MLHFGGLNLRIDAKIGGSPQGEAELQAALEGVAEDAFDRFGLDVGRARDIRGEPGGEFLDIDHVNLLEGDAPPLVSGRR